MKQFIKITNWVLFGISVAIFMASVYNAVQGRLLNLAVEVSGVVPGALIVAGIVTTSWMINGAALKLRLVQSGSLEWYGTALLAIVAFAVDILIMAALAFQVQVPPNLPLLVVMGHAGLHFVLWIVTAYDVERRDGGVLSTSFRPAEELVPELQQQVAALAERTKQAESMLKQAESTHVAAVQKLERQLERAEERAEKALEDATRSYEASCEYCGKTYHKPTQLQADRAVSGHQLHCQEKPVASANGHRRLVNEA